MSTILGICLVLVVVLFSADTIIEKKIRSQFLELSPVLQIKFSRVKSRLFSSSVSFDSLQISFTPYANQEQHVFVFRNVSLQGVSFLKFLFHKKLVAKNLVLADGDIRLSQYLLEKKDSVQMQMVKELKLPFKNLSIDRVQLRQSKIFLQSAQVELLAQGNASLRGVAIDKPGDKPVFSGFDVDLSDIDYPASDFTVRIRRLRLSSANKTMAIN